ncbi:MOB kinase activator 3A isoform X2 [Myotis myotis]|uniref:MOB kinase activator 3A isoform X2 n=1 Tax=Myotis myotis TaxID=51298 RepID=UPI001748376E|nr:MOB kinase activator 3A isoform X2 [Myotis myotis]
MSNPFLKQVFNKDKTFRPKRKFEPGTQRFELHKKAQASLNAGLDLKLAVQLPSGEELNDWVAVHVVDFFNRVNLIYGTISDGCTEQSCPIMSGGPKYEYRWQDEHKFRKPTALSAPRYMDLLMDWIEVQINNEDIFPTNVAVLGDPHRGPSHCHHWHQHSTMEDSLRGTSSWSLTGSAPGQVSHPSGPPSPSVQGTGLPLAEGSQRPI